MSVSLGGNKADSARGLEDAGRQGLLIGPLAGVYISRRDMPHTIDPVGKIGCVSYGRRSR